MSVSESTHMSKLNDARLLYADLSNLLVSRDLCVSIAQLRRQLRHKRTTHLLFLDETALRLSEAPTHTLVHPGEKAYVLTEETASYASRYDMIALTVGDRVLLPKIYSPKDRKRLKVQGINANMLLQFIDDTLAQAVEGLNRYPLTLILDRAPIHLNTAAILQAFHDRGSGAIKNIILMPPNAAKRLSPLDNSIFHVWKEKVRKRCPVSERNIEQLMNDAWDEIRPQAHYRNCGLTELYDPYFDCPDPANHRHRR